MKLLAMGKYLFPAGVLILSLGAAPLSLKAGAAPRQGGVLHVAYWGAPRTLDYCSDASAFAAQAWSPIYEGLLTFDYKPGEDFRKEQKVIPNLAERWERPNNTTYIFHLRKGVKWHDGQTFTADDVVFSLNYIRDPANACQQRGHLAGIKSIEKIDVNTVRITTDAPFAPFLENLAQREVIIFPKHIYDSGNLFKGASGVVGTGPMKLKSFDFNEKFVYEAFENYWKRRPYLDGIVAYIIKEPQSRLAAFIGNRLDLLIVADKAQNDAALAKVPNAVSDGFSSSTGYSIYLRMDRPPFNDIRVRRAIHLALNRHDMVKTLSFGVGKMVPPAISAISNWAIPQEQLSKLPGYRLPKDKDIDEAKRLLREAGHGDGMTFSIQAVAVWQNPRIAEVAAQQLKDVGITVKLDFIEGGMYFANQRKGNFQAELNGMSPEYFDASLQRYYHSKGGNAARIADPELDNLIELQRRTLDTKKRREIVRKIQEYLLEKMYVIPTVELAFYWINHPYVHDFVSSRSTQLQLYRAADIWLDERAPKRTLP